MINTLNLQKVSTFDLMIFYVYHVSGFISIDCGRPYNSSYSEKTTGLLYISDATFIDSGESNSISSGYKDDYQQQLWYLRSFPDGIRNCYKITNITNGSKYLIRAGFLYGNYDGQDTLPVFSLYLGSNFWDTIKFKNAATDLVKEIIHIPLQNYQYICLVNTGFGIPIISSIELRPLSTSTYETKTGSLAMVSRFDTGPIADKGYR